MAGGYPCSAAARYSLQASEPLMFVCSCKWQPAASMLLPHQPRAVRRCEEVLEEELAVRRPVNTCRPHWVCADLVSEQANGSFGAACEETST